MFEPVTARKLMKDSMCFKVTCLVFVLTLIGGITEAIVLSTSDCGYTSNYYASCASINYQRSYQCSRGATKYCCSYSYSSCGDSYCNVKPYDYYTYTYYEPCYGHQLAMWILFALGFILSIVITIKRIKFSQKATEENMRNALYFQAANNYQPAPQLIYVPNQHNQNRINNSEQNWIEEPMLR